MKDLLKKINWKMVMYWYVSMFLLNVVLIPLVVIKEPITFPRVVINAFVWFFFAIYMSLKPKKVDKQ